MNELHDPRNLLLISLVRALRGDMSALSAVPLSYGKPPGFRRPMLGLGIVHRRNFLVDVSAVTMAIVVDVVVNLRYPGGVEQ